MMELKGYPVLIYRENLRRDVNRFRKRRANSTRSGYVALVLLRQSLDQAVPK